MQKNQPKKISRRQMLSLSPYFMGASMASGMFMTASLFGAHTADSSELLKIVPASDPLPDIGLMNDKGEPFFLSSMADRPLLINFWATWCAPCVVELPMLEAAARILLQEDIQCVLISMDRGGPKIARPFLEQRGIKTPLSLYDPKAEMGRAVGLRGLPTTLFVKKDRAEYAQHTGPAIWNDTAVLDQLRAYLKS